MDSRIIIYLVVSLQKNLVLLKGAAAGGRARKDSALQADQQNNRTRLHFFYCIIGP